MAISTVGNSGKPAYGIQEYFVDVPEDIEKLPKDDAVGSSALVITTGDIYLINSKGQWVLF